jgi:hypothetical protein
MRDAAPARRLLARSERSPATIDAMIRRTMMTLAICVGAGVAVAQEPAKPPRPATTAPARPAPMATPELEAAAAGAFDDEDYGRALMLYQDLAVRLRNSPDRVAPILEKVRICEANLAQKGTVIEGINAPRTPHPKPTAGRTYDVGLQKLGNFNYDAERGGNIPDDVKALTGATLKLRGYMIPIDQSDQVKQFVLVPSLFACCFGQPPALQHTVLVSCPPGKAVGYYAEELSVTGTLRVEERREDGFITSIFELQASSIRPAQ